MQPTLKNELGLKPLKFQKVQEFTDGQKRVRLEQVKELLRLHESAQLPNLAFSDKKPFQIEQLVNKQNDRLYLPKRSVENLHMRMVTRTQTPPMVMVWAAVTANGRSLLVFIDHALKINAKYFWEDVLKIVLKLWAAKHFSRRPYTFQQDSAPAHSAQVNQEWLRKEVPRFISTA